MKILAVDTALGACSIALLDGNDVVAHHWTAMARGHAEALAPMVARGLHQAGLTLSDIDRLAVTTGPGTFTGQRVGLAFMRGLRLALDRPLVGITTLEAMAAAASAESGLSAVATLHAAKRNEVYAALFVNGEPLLQVQVADFATMMANIRTVMHRSESLALAGTGAEAAANWLKQHGGSVELTTVRQPDALWVARLAARVLYPAEKIRPLYLRAPDAKLAANAVRLRPAVSGDGKLLAALNEACLQQAWEAHFFERILQSPGGFGFIAEANGTAVGFALARAVAGEAEILAIGVARAFRRNGIGRRLLRETTISATELGASTLFLEVAAGNQPARNLYENHGFRIMGKRKDYYKGREDALLLRTVLPLEIPSLGNFPKID